MLLWGDAALIPLPPAWPGALARDREGEGHTLRRVQDGGAHTEMNSGLQPEATEDELEVQMERGLRGASIWAGVRVNLGGTHVGARIACQVRGRH